MRSSNVSGNALSGRAARSNSVELGAHAGATLQYIRASMDAATSVAVPGSAGFAMGMAGLGATGLSSTPALQDHWFAIWLFASFVAAVLGGVLMQRRSSLQGLALAGAPVRKLLLCLLPSLFGGAVMTAVLWSSGNMHAIPGTWLLLYGCALIAASVSTTAVIALMGGLFACLGLVAFALPASLQIVMLGCGFGGLHLLFGFILGRRRS
jgi:hypothetical protein